MYRKERQPFEILYFLVVHIYLTVRKNKAHMVVPQHLLCFQCYILTTYSNSLAVTQLNMMMNNIQEYIKVLVHNTPYNYYFSNTYTTTTTSTSTTITKTTANLEILRIKYYNQPG